MIVWASVSRAMKAVGAFPLVLILCGPLAAEDLPPDILADKLMLEAAIAIEGAEPEKALRALGHIQTLNVERPPMYAYLYGKVLVEHGADEDAWRKGHALVTKFVVGIERTSEHYTRSLELLLAAEARLETAAGQARLAERLPDIRQELRSRMVRVEGGSFVMGCTPEQENCGPDESPVRSVQVASFEIGRYEVTQELWQAVMGENPSAFGDCPRCPVETVSWDDVQMFLRKLNEGGGAVYRLPSEAEWEYAARGGQRSRGHQYAGSDDWAELAWYYENAGNRTHPIGQKKANELGLFDMSGNVREWVQDSWHGSYVDAPGDGRAWEVGDCGRRVIRGGSWYGKPSYVRSANRFWYATYFRNNNLGFRLALTPGE